MAKVVVDTYKLNQYAQRLATVNNVLARIDGDLDKLYIKTGILDVYKLVRNDAVGGYRWRIRRCKEYLEMVARKYETTEKNLQYDTAIDAMSQGSDSEFWSTAKKILGKAGFIGKTAANAVGLITTDITKIDGETVIGAAKAVTGAVGGIKAWTKAVKNRKIYANFGKQDAADSIFKKKMFGLNDAFDGKASRFGANWNKLNSLSALGKNLKLGVSDGWGKRFTRNFAKSMKDEVGDFAKKGKAVGAWIGVGISFFSNALQNQQEARDGDITRTRAVAETVTETLVDVGTGWVIGSAVAAGVAASIGSAPVLLVGAATVGITMGLDYACKKITGALTGTEKGLTETVSDLVLDVGEAVVKGATKVVSVVKDVATKIGNGISNGAKKFGNAIKNLFKW